MVRGRRFPAVIASALLCVSCAENVWRALARESPDSSRLAKTHPTSPERFILMRQTIAEIADKERRNLPLVPELKTTQAESQPAPAREQSF